MTSPLLTRRSAGAAAALFSLALGGVSVAWACSPFQPTAGVKGTTAGSHASGPVGSEITFTGRDFAPGTPVQVRWNSPGGTLLAEARGPSFSVPVTIPQAPAGMHYIMAVAAVGQSTSLAFEVTPSATVNPQTSSSGGTNATTAAGSENGSTTSNTNQQSGPGSTATSASENSAGRSAADSSATQSDSGSTASGAQGPEPARSATNTGASGASSTTPGGSGATAGAPAGGKSASTASASPALVTTAGGQAVFGGSTAPAASQALSAATVSGDTWSGFGADTKPSLLTDRLPNSGSAPSSGLGVGIGLLGAGVVALFAGFAAAESARKRAFAGTGGR